MPYTHFVAAVLNITPDNICILDSYSLPNDSLAIKIKLTDQHLICPYCKSNGIVHGYTKKKLTHAALNNRECIIFYMQRRYKCSECGTTYSEQSPFAHAGDNLTYETKINILKDLKNVDLTYTRVAKNNNVSVTEVIRVFDKHVKIPRKPLPLVLSIDENYFPTTDFSDAKYACLLMDFLTGEIVDVLPDRKKNLLFRYFSNLKLTTTDYRNKRSELDNVGYISIDLSYLFLDVAHTFFPHAIVCADSFHVIKHLNDDFNKVRIRCCKSTEDESLRYFLNRFRDLFNHNAKLDNEPKFNRTLNRYMNYRDIRDYLFQKFPDMEIAYNLREYYLSFNKNNTFETADAQIDSVIHAFANSGLPEFEEFYIMIRNWRQEIVNSFTVIQGRRINNSYIESQNRQVARLKYGANGFTNFKRARNRIMYCLNEKDTFTL